MTNVNLVDAKEYVVRHFAEQGITVTVLYADFHEEHGEGVAIVGFDMDREYRMDVWYEAGELYGEW